MRALEKGKPTGMPGRLAAAQEELADVCRLGGEDFSREGVGHPHEDVPHLRGDPHLHVLQVVSRPAEGEDVKDPSLHHVVVRAAVGQQLAERFGYQLGVGIAGAGVKGDRYAELPEIAHHCGTGFVEPFGIHQTFLYMLFDESTRPQEQDDVSKFHETSSLDRYDFMALWVHRQLLKSSSRPRFFRALSSGL